MSPLACARTLRLVLSLSLLAAAGCADATPELGVEPDAEPDAEDDDAAQWWRPDGGGLDLPWFPRRDAAVAPATTPTVPTPPAGPTVPAAPEVPTPPTTPTPPATPPVASGDLIVAPTGVATAPGTLEAPTTLTAALTRVAPGGRILLRGGVYASSVQITIARENAGTAAARKQLHAYPNEKPVLDFASQPYGREGNPRGLQIDGHFWHVKGLTVRGSADNGIYVAGNDNIVEQCITHGNRDTGLQLGRFRSTAATIDEWPRNNLILDCESYDNYDVPPGSGENADGFAAKLTVGPGNVFRGCVAHHNIDDGWDLYTKTDTGPIGVVTIDRSVAHHNGTLTTGVTNAQGDRNGFKLGGEKIPVAHVVTRSVAYANGKNGFTWNSNPGAMQVSNNLAFDNVEGNYNFGTNSVRTAAVFTNNVSVWTRAGAKADKAIGSDVAGSNVWAIAAGTARSAAGKVATAADFTAPLATVSLRRVADGSLDLSVFQLAAGSDLVDAGEVPTVLPFAATYFVGKPDLGPFETR
ncbi:MAG: right-handed parallel beta-helix repeat-containing protein [Polyangiales bacterium]